MLDSSDCTAAARGGKERDVHGEEDKGNSQCGKDNKENHQLVCVSGCTRIGGGVNNISPSSSPRSLM